MASEVDISGGAMHIGTAFCADGVSDENGIVVRRCPGCSSGVATYTERAGVMVMHCSAGCTPETILKALRDALTGSTAAPTYPRQNRRYEPPADTDTEEL